ncbi:extracellular solute-binding protein [Streptomyces sp. NPDC021093]|uniref:extracellular solute-binding protein n=1 Tax=Streptomyces sp. NPDC021093 TaxID=3365112 RepID=UPI0037A2A2C9
MNPHPRTGRVRAVAAALLLALALLLPTGCTLAAPGGGAPAEDRVTVLGPWTEEQETRFTALLDGFGIPYTYQGTAAQREVLLSQVQAGTAPDVAIMPGVGELADYAANGQLKPLDWLDPEDLKQYGDPWLSRTGDHKVRWVPVKADLKSIVWHRKGRLPPLEPAPAAAWCMGMGDDGASGWPGSDWIEDIVLQSQGPEVYEGWASGRIPWTDPRIASAWRAWGALMAKDDAAARTALLTDHRGPAPAPSETGGGLLFGGGACTLEHQGSFASAFYGPKAADAEFVDSAKLLPGGPYPQRGHEVSADFAVLFNDTPQARALLSRLVSREGQEEWAGDGKVFSARSDVLTGRLPDAGVRCLDASDVMSPAVRDAFYEAVLLYLADPGQNPAPRLAGIQKVQTVQKEQEKQRANGARTVGVTEVCSESH